MDTAGDGIILKAMRVIDCIMNILHITCLPYRTFYILLLCFLLTCSSLVKPTPTPTAPTPSEGIIGIDLQQRDTGDAFNPFGPLQSTFTRPAGSDPSISEDAFFGLGKFFQGKERGTLGNRLQKQFQTGQKLPSFAAAIAGAQSPFNINSKNYNYSVKIVEIELSCFSYSISIFVEKINIILRK